MESIELGVEIVGCGGCGGGHGGVKGRVGPCGGRGWVVRSQMTVGAGALVSFLLGLFQCRARSDSSKELC